MKGYARQHYEYARTGVPTQECDTDMPEPKKTDWDAGTRDGGAERTPHREEKSEDR